VIYAIFTNQQVQPGMPERVVFSHPGPDESAMQYAQQLVGKYPVQYQVVNLTNQQLPPQVICIQPCRNAPAAAGPQAPAAPQGPPPPPQVPNGGLGQGNINVDGPLADNQFRQLSPDLLDSLQP